MSDTIVKTAFFSASRDTVWAFLTDKDKLAQWFYGAESNLVDGQDYALTAQDEAGATVKKCWGRVLEMDRPQRLVYSFTIKPLGGAMTTVTWTLEEVFGGTKLTLKHEGIAAAAGEAALGLLAGLDAGWDRHLAQLREAAGLSFGG